MVSIILPVYNSEKYIHKCINSILNQIYANWELIVIDDGSSDNSFNIIKEFADMDKRINLHHFENRGVAASRNTGIMLAKGEYITFIDSDDYVTPDYLDKLVNGIEMYDCDISSCDVLEVYNGNNRIIACFVSCK